MADASSLLSSTNKHFFQPLLPSFNSHLNIPIKFFSENIEGKHEGKIVRLRSYAFERTWQVNMEGHRLTNGWRDFVNAHSLRVGDIVVFRHEGDLLFHVTALGPSCCEIQYTLSSSRHNEEEEEDDESETESFEKEYQENQTKESEKSLFGLNCFSQNVTASNLSRDCAGVPKAFAKRNGLSKESQKIVLMNEEGKSWPSKLIILSSSRVVIIRGWTSFCTANTLGVGDSCTFKLLRDKGKPVFQLCSLTKAKKSQPVEENITKESRENRFVKMEQSPLEAWAHKRARAEKGSQENTTEEGEPSHRMRTSLKTRSNQGNLRDKKPCSCPNQMAEVKQNVVDTLASIRRFRAELETMEQKLECSLKDIDS